MIRMIPIDGTRLDTTATGTVSPVPVFVEMPDGSRRPDPNGTQATTDEGVLLWTVDALVYEITRDGENSEVIGVQVPAPQRPVVGRLQPIAFHGLTLRSSVHKASNQMRQYWQADAIAEQTRQHKQRDEQAAA